MANFFVKVRTDYRDVAGLALDLAPTGTVDDGDGLALRWTNSARRRKLTRARFGNAFQTDAAQRPTIDVDGGVVMASATSQLIIPLEDGTFGPGDDLAIAFQVSSLTTGVGNKVLLSNDAATFKLYQRDTGAGNYGYYHNGANVLGASALQAGVHLLNVQGGAVPEATWYKDFVSQFTGALTDVTFAGATALYLGNPPGGDVGIDATLRSLRIWDRALSPSELDFVHRSLEYSGTDLSVLTYADVSTPIWEDKTADGISQVRRVNPLPGAPHRYHYATGAFPMRVQLACEIDAEVLPDTSLAGALFSASVLEQPVSSAAVTFAQDTGWSAVFDVILPEEGHYTLQIARDGKGSKIVHLDAATEAS